MESILNSIKKLLGISEDVDHFDSDIIMHINSVFMTLGQLGIGPSEGYSIQDDLNTWSEFIPDDAKTQMIKPYMYLKVQLLFDPPTNSSVLSAKERMISEMEWRLNVAAESDKGEN